MHCRWYNNIYSFNYEVRDVLTHTPLQLRAANTLVYCESYFNEHVCWHEAQWILYYIATMLPSKKIKIAIFFTHQATFNNDKVETESFCKRKGKNETSHWHILFRSFDKVPLTQKMLKVDFSFIITINLSMIFFKLAWKYWTTFSISWMSCLNYHWAQFNSFIPQQKPFYFVWQCLIGCKRVCTWGEEHNVGVDVKWT